MLSPLQQIGVVILALALLPLVLKLLVKFRLLPLLIYALLAGTVFVRWTEAHETLSMVIFYGIIALVAASWIVTLLRYIAEERAARNYLIATAIPMYKLYEQAEPVMEETPPVEEWEDEDEYDYWYDR